MRVASVVALLCLMTSMSSPLCVVAYDTPGDGVQYLMTVDVCHAGHAAFSVSAAGPFLVCSTCPPVPPASVVFGQAVNQDLSPLLLANSKDRPPQA